MLYEQPRLYDALYDGFHDDIPFFLRLAKATDQPVCELACGTGRVAVALAEKGVPVLGIDLSLPMVEAARERARSAGGAAGSAEFIHGDMREPHGTERFGAVFVPLHSLSHLTSADDLLTALAAIHQSLVPGGTLALALHNPDAAYLARSNEGLERVHPHLSAVAVYETHQYFPVSQLLELKWYIETAEETSLVTFSLRMIYPEELLVLLRYAGFDVAERYGWYDGRPLRDDSGTQIVVARRL